MSQDAPGRDVNITGQKRQRGREGDDSTGLAAVPPVDGSKKQPGWTLKSTVKEVLLGEHKCLGEMKAGDFLRKHFGDTITIPDVSMTVFVKNPKDYITDAAVLAGIWKVPQVKMLREAGYLSERGVLNLKQWDEEVSDAIKGAAGPVVRDLLNGAVDGAKSDEERALLAMNGKTVEGAYESVYNATWGFVESNYYYFPPGRKPAADPLTLWPKEVVDITPGPDELIHFSVPHSKLGLAVLTSPMGWPHTWFKHNGSGETDVNAKGDEEYEFEDDVYVRRETLRVWYKVEEEIERGLTGAVTDKTRFYHLISTCDIGRSRGAGPLLLHKLLHYESDVLQVIIYVVKGRAYVFRKPRGSLPGQVTFYYKYDEAFTAVEKLTSDESNDLKGYVIFDAGKDHRASAKPPSGCGGIVMRSPDGVWRSEWGEWDGSRFLYMNCDTLSDLESIHVWRWIKIHSTCVLSSEEAMRSIRSEWYVMEERARVVGPILCHIISELSYDRRVEELSGPIRQIGVQSPYYYALILGGFFVQPTSAPYRHLVQVVRVEEPGVACDSFRCRPLSNHIFDIMSKRVAVLFF